MNPLPARPPMLLLLVAFAMGVAIGVWARVPLWCAIICVIVLYVASLRRSRLAGVALFAAFAMAGVAAARSEYRHEPPPIGEPIEMLLTVDDNPTDRGTWLQSSAKLNWYRTSADSTWRRADRRVLLATDPATQLSAGERIAIVGRVRPLADSTNSYVRLMTARGYVGRTSIYASTPLVRVGDTGSITRLSRRLQGWAVERLRASRLSDDELALCTAIATGKRTAMSAQLREYYTLSGSAHLLAVSGLHVAIVLVVANILLRWLTLFRRGNQLLNVAVVMVVWGYAAMTGLAISAVRAALMFSALQFAMASGSSYRSANILATVAMAMLAVRPSLIVDVSFQLSVVAVAAIIYWAVPLCASLRTRNPILNLLTSTVVIGVVCTLATAPLVAHWFGRVAVVGVVLNPLVVVLGYLLVTLSVATIFVPSSWGWVARAAGWVAEAENRSVAVAAQLDWAHFTLSLDWWVVVIIYAIAIAITELVRRNPRKKSLSLPYV